MSPTAAASNTAPLSPSPEDTVLPVTAHQLQFRWETSLDAIGKQAWDACFGTDNVYDSFELADALEHANIQGVEFHYLVGSHQGQVAFLLPCFRFQLSLSLLAPSAVQAWIARVRRVFPEAMFFNTFIAGSPVAICKDSLGLRRLPRQEWQATVARAGALLIERGRQLGTGFVFFKEITVHQRPLIEPALRPDFLIVESLPTMFVPLSGEGLPSYSERLRTKQRVLMRKRRRMFQEAGLRWEIATDFTPYAEAFIPLYLQVLERAETRLETLTADFFREVSRRLGDRSFALLCFKGERLIAFELFLRDEKWLQPMYLGMDYAYRDEASLYFNCLYQILEECEKRGYPVVQLGQSAYEAKGLMGAVMSRLYLGIYHPNRWVRLVLSRFQPVLFPSLPVPKHQPFKDPELSQKLLATRDVRHET